MLKLRRLDTEQANFDTELQALTAFDRVFDEAIESKVKTILHDVKQRGDIALVGYTARFDDYAADEISALEIKAQELAIAYDRLPEAQRQALEEAAQRIRAYHQHQLSSSWSYRDEQGTVLGQQITALDRVGVYVPGGKAAYPSSVLMNVLPAKVAGVGEIILTTPTQRGERNPMVLAAAQIAGVDRLFTIGGAQAIAALAYGTQTVPAVDKIVGPGNAYVAAAKRQVFGAVGIDMIAGPSEVVVIADHSAEPVWLTQDLFAQAEHDEQAQAILLSPDAALLDAVASEINKRWSSELRSQFIATSLNERGALIKVRDLSEACAVANRIAPEHLELALAEPEHYLPLIRHAGAIFLGHLSSEALGDYCAGPNHVLPTARSARFASPLGVYDFQKRSSLIKVSSLGAEHLGKLAAVLARSEGLAAHARAAELRYKGEER